MSANEAPKMRWACGRVAPGQLLSHAGKEIRLSHNVILPMQCEPTSYGIPTVRAPCVTDSVKA